MEKLEALQPASDDPELKAKWLDDYAEYLKHDLGEIIDLLDINPLEKRAIKSRWLDQVLWMEKKASTNRDNFFFFRRMAIIGGVIVPVLVGIKSIGVPIFDNMLYGITIVISVVVAASTALEEFFSYGDQWRHYRQAVEGLKIEAWEFFQLVGSYRRYKSHSEAYKRFAHRVEEMIRADVNVYVSEIVGVKERDKEEHGDKQE